MDDVEQPDGLASLVRLQAADAVQPDTGMTLEQRRPLRERLMHAALAEVLLPGNDQRLDFLGSAAFAHRDELHVFGLATRKPGRRCNLVENLLPTIGSAHHARAIGRPRTARQ